MVSNNRKAVAMTQEKLLKIIERHVADLMEHCDAVQIFVTQHNAEEGITMAVDRGDGNWYARYGMVKEWVGQEDCRAQQIVNGDEDFEHSS